MFNKTYINGGDHWDFYLPLFYLSMCVGMAAVSCLIVQMSTVVDATEDHLHVENTARYMFVYYFALNLFLTIFAFQILGPIK